MTDTKEIVEFIKTVEKHPCVYNITMPEYSNRTETKRAWCEIAETMNSTEHECKDRWRKLRIAFMRSLKHAKASPQNKLYYLYDYLTFLLPYVKNSEQYADTEEIVTNLSPNCSDNEDMSMKNRRNEIDCEEDRNYFNGHAVYLNDRYEKQRQVNRKRKKDDEESNPRKLFLLSIFPEVESFSEEEMRTFRRTVVNCIDNIIDSRKKS